jgi:hypothetical protein
MSSNETFYEYLLTHPQLSGFVNLYSQYPEFFIIDTLQNTQIFIPTNDALALVGSILNNLTTHDIRNIFLYSIVPLSSNETQCTLLPGYSIQKTNTTVNSFPLLTFCNLSNGNIVYTIDGYLLPFEKDPQCI